MSRLAYFLGGVAAGALSVGSFVYLREAATSTPPALRPPLAPSPAIPISDDPHEPNHLAAVLREFGFPGPVHDVLYRTAYVACHSRQLRHPLWVLEHLTEANLRPGNGTDRGRSTFHEDPWIPTPYRARLADYFRSGYDRGHMAPAADAKRSQDALDETFFLTNICPQVGDGFNRDYWAWLEEWCRAITRGEHNGRGLRDVYVASGALYLPELDPATGKFLVRYEVIGHPAPSVSVPTHFYKVVLARDDDASLHLAAFVLPNAAIAHDTPLTEFRVPIEVVERAAGLEFFQNARADGKSVGDLCERVQCEVVARKFEAAQRDLRRRSVASAKGSKASS